MVFISFLYIHEYPQQLYYLHLFGRYYLKLGHASKSKKCYVFSVPCEEVSMPSPCQISCRVCVKHVLEINIYGYGHVLVTF